MTEWHRAFDERPTGVTVIAILYLIDAGIAFIGIAVVVYLASQIDFFAPYPMPGKAFAQPMIEDSSFMSIITVSVSIVLGVIGGINTLIGIGLLKARSWARNLAIVFAIINIIIYSLAIPGTLGASLAMVFFNGFILWYLYRPQVVTYFRR